MNASSPIFLLVILQLQPVLLQTMIFGRDGTKPFDELGRDGTEPFDELGRDWERPKGHLEDDPQEVFRPYVVVEVAGGTRPSSTLLGRTLAWNLAGAPR
jgi:hypothetical protein